MDSAERVVARIVTTSGDSYWFTDRRLLTETHGRVEGLFRYSDVARTDWMFKGGLVSELTTSCADSADEITSLIPKMKSQHFDRLVVATRRNDVVLEGPSQAYQPVLVFLQWLVSRPND